MFLKCLGFYRSNHTTTSQRPYPTIIEELCHQFSLADIKKSTNNFDHKRLLNLEIFDSEIYQGCLLHTDGSDYTVTIKRFNEDWKWRWDLFKNEIELLCQIHHPNCISLIGFCNHEKEKIVVYEYMSNGSLYRHLQRGELSWKKRLEICIGTARGLHYLHAGAKRTIIHSHIKPSNILLDDNMQPKLADFRISVQGPRFTSKPKPFQVDSAKGTLGYMAMEHLSSLTISDKTDVYSFGMVLLEVVCGGKYVKEMMSEREFLESPVEEKIDPNIKGNIAPECWEVFINIIQRCVKYEADERPTMGEVEVELEHALLLQEQADITNTNVEYTLLSKTIINYKPEREFECPWSFQDITEDRDFENMFRWIFDEL